MKKPFDLTTGILIVFAACIAISAIIDTCNSVTP